MACDLKNMFDYFAENVVCYASIPFGYWVLRRTNNWK